MTQNHDDSTGWVPATFDAATTTYAGAHANGAVEDPAIVAILEKIGDWSAFDVFQLSKLSQGRPLQLVTIRLLTELGVVQRLQLDITRLSNFLAAAEAAYLNQPYHNSTHAADVVQALGAMMLTDTWASCLEDWEALAVVMAAAVHDLGHPGVNNDFHQRTQSDPAKQYGELGSINERFHAAMAVALMENETNALQSLGSMKSEFLELVDDLILSTDMAKHGGMVEEFSASLEKYGSDLGSWPPEERRRALRMMLHCADISNPARPLTHCTEWGRRVQEELFSQGDLEREKGLEVTPACDRSSTAAWHSQALFIRRVMRPCIATLRPLAPVFVGMALPHIQESLNHWLSHGKCTCTDDWDNNELCPSHSGLVTFIAP